MQTLDYVSLENEFGAHNYHPLDVVIERAAGAWVWDIDGKKYLDCLAAYSAVNQGHCHPKILAAFVEQARRVTLIGDYHLDGAAPGTSGRPAHPEPFDPPARPPSGFRSLWGPRGRSIIPSMSGAGLR